MFALMIFDIVASYGPCQTPTLGFCVQRHLQITTFKPEKFWSLHPHIVKIGHELQLEWGRDKLFDNEVSSTSGILETSYIFFLIWISSSYCRFL